MNIPKIDLPRVVVIGAGFAGLQIARRLNTNKYQLVLIDRNNYHTFQPLLYQVASASLEPDSIAYPIRKTLRKKKNTFYRMASVKSINQNESVIKTDIGNLKYDKLIIATGANNNFFGNVSFEENALPMKRLTDSLDLRSKILGNFEQALNTHDLHKREELMNFVIVGAGPTGVELAGALAELKNKILPKDFPDLDFRAMSINLIEAAPRVLSSMNDQSSLKAHKYLKGMGVNIWTKTFVEKYENNTVITRGDLLIKSDTVIWAAGVKGDAPKGFHPEEIGKGNRVITDGHLRLISNDNIYILGDAGLIQSEQYPEGLPMLASVAMQEGAYLAKALNSPKKYEDKPFSYVDKGTMATIGKNLAVVELGKFRFQGLMAWFVWMFVHLMLLVGFRNRVVVFVNWAWNYIRFNSGLRLIVRPFKRHKKKKITQQKVETELVS
ncbi:MAG: NAD(P)/FAD-dependent oxidoreductase [Reichenbachiella sp.]